MSNNSAMADKRHELLDSIVAHCAQILEEHGIEEELARQAGNSLANHLSEIWAGSTVCFPKDYFYKLTKRDLEILGKFNGRNHHVLAQEYGLTENAIYRLLKRIQDRKFDRDQGKLDLDNSGIELF